MENHLGVLLIIGMVENNGMTNNHKSLELSKSIECRIIINFGNVDIMDTLNNQNHGMVESIITGYVVK